MADTKCEMSSKDFNGTASLEQNDIFGHLASQDIACRS